MIAPEGTEQWSQTGFEGRVAPDWAAPALGWQPPPPWWVGQCRPPRPGPEWMPEPCVTNLFPSVDIHIVHWQTTLIMTAWPLNLENKTVLGGPD